jgi:CelD/BcsL family acetyltransferase involved in cellulose biosynthesis
MKITEVNKHSDFVALEQTWNDVLWKCDHSIFSTWEWLSAWWKHFGNDKRLLLLLAEDNDKIIGIAPLMYSVHKMFGLRIGKIEFIGTPDSDYNDFIITEKGEECIKRFIDYLNNLPEKWDCIELTDIPEHAKPLLFLNKISNNVKPVHACPYTSLPESFDVFLKGLSHNRRYDLRRNIGRLERNFKVEFTFYSGSQSAIQGINEFFELHQKRWRSRGFTGIFAEQKIRNFHLDIAKSFSQKGWLGLFSLKLSGNPVAALYGFKYRSKFYYYLSGFDPRYSRYSVGNLLMSFVIGECIQEGFAEFDFLRGAEEYKDRWNTMTRWNYQAILTRRGSLAKVQNWLYREYWRQGNRLKYLLKMH